MIGEKLKYVRTYHGDRQTDLAHKINVSVSTVKSWERNHSSPNYETLIQICKLYHVTADFLIGVTDTDPFLEHEKHEKLTPKNKALVRLFEEFMLYRQEKETKK